MDCAAACSAYVRDGRGEAAARKAPAGKTGFAGSDAVWCGRLSHGSCRSLWSGKPHAVQGPAVQAVSCGWTGNAVRLTPGGTAIAAWGDRLAVRCHPAVVCRWRSDWEDISIFHALMGAARGRRRGVCPG